MECRSRSRAWKTCLFGGRGTGSGANKTNPITTETQRHGENLRGRPNEHYCRPNRCTSCRCSGRVASTCVHALVARDCSFLSAEVAGGGRDCVAGVVLGGDWLRIWEFASFRRIG